MRKILVGTLSALALAVVCISRPALAATDKTISSLTTGGAPTDVVVVGNYAYVADGLNGITVVDVTNRTSLSVVRHVFVPDIPNHVVVDGSTLYVADNTVVPIKNLVDPSNPATYSTVTPAHSMTIVGDVAANGNTLYIVAGDNTNLELQKYDVTNRAAPSFVTSTTLITGQTHGAGSITLSGNYAYVVSLHTLFVINLSSMTVAGSYTDSTATFNGIEVTNSVAYMSGNGLHAVSVADPAAMVSTFSATDNTHSGSGIAASNGYLFLPQDTGELKIYDIASTGSPVYVDTLGGATYGSGVTIANDVAYVANGTLLQLFDVSQPDNIPPVVTLDPPPGGSDPGTIVLNPGTKYTDPGVTATDNVGGNISGQVVITGSVNIKKVGKYVLTYTSTDRGGNVTSVKRTVIVAPSSTKILTDRSGYYGLHVGKSVVTLKPFGVFRGTILARKLVLDTTSNPYYLFVSLGANARPKAVLYSSVGKLVSSQDLSSIGTRGLFVDLVSDPKNLAMMMDIAVNGATRRVNVYTISPKGVKAAGAVTTGPTNSVIVIKLLKFYSGEMALGTMVRGKTSTIKIWRYNSKVKQFVWDKKYNTAVLKLTSTSIALK